LLLELKNKQKKFTGRADTAQNVWNLPSLQDEEGTRTRLNECPTVPLILAKSADERAVILLEGQTIPTQSVRFDYATAKTLHRNIVKAPAWWFGVKSRFLKSVPSAVSKMVSLHIHGTVEIAVIEGTTISTESLGDGRALELPPARKDVLAQAIWDRISQEFTASARKVLKPDDPKTEHKRAKGKHA